MAGVITDEQVAFVRDRLSEDEVSAKAACLFGSGNWVQDDPERYEGHIDSDTGTVTYDEGSPTRDQAAHIARYNPARVLREVEVWRRLLLETRRRDWTRSTQAPSGRRGSSWRSVSP